MEDKSSKSRIRYGIVPAAFVELGLVGMMLGMVIVVPPVVRLLTSWFY